jgi:Holliday junction DNA helicase RuvA
VIARLEGVLRELAPTRIVIDVGGVGYDVQIPLSTFSELPDLGKTVALHVYTYAREGAIQLFGFATLDERTAFDLLLRANRVGPRLAQTILSGISTAELLDAIRGGRVHVLRAVPGVGTKMAERILVELRDRADALEAALALRGAAARTAAAPPSPEDSVREQTLSALVNLGYPRSHAERVIEAAAADTGSDATLETLVRAALRRLLR